MRAAPLWLAAVLLLAACASDGDGGPSAGGGPDGPRRLGPSVFVSPAGEPFRAAPGEPYPSAAWFRRADTDGDGRLTLAEFLADAERAFRRYDTDGNGVIDGFEIADYEQRIAPEILPRIGRLRADEGQDTHLFEGERGGGGRRGGAGRGRGGEPERRGRLRAGDDLLSGAAAYGMLAEPEPLRAADADLDGKVSLAEWRARTRRRFTLLDTTSAGALTLAALPRTAVQEQAERCAGRRPGAAPRR